jgi:hypothetical protein
MVPFYIRQIELCADFGQMDESAVWLCTALMWTFTRRFVSCESDGSGTGYSAVSRSVLRSSLPTRAAV